MVTARKPAHVLLIGIDAYPRSPLHGCANDARAVERLLVDRLGVDPARITRLLSPHAWAHREEEASCRPATLANIRAALMHLGSNAVAPGEPVFIHYSGHGTQCLATSVGSRFFREALVPVDFEGLDGKRKLLFDHELNRLLGDIGRRTQNVTFVLDCCCSAGATRNGLLPGGASDRFLRMARDGSVGTGTVPPPDGARGVARAAADGIAACQVVAACLADERAREVDDAHGWRYGALTRALLAELGALEPDALQGVRWGEIWARVLAHVASVSPAQHPWLYGDFGRRVFDGGGDHARLGFGIVQRGTRYDIDAGTLLGVTPGAVLAVERSAPGRAPLSRP